MITKWTLPVEFLRGDMIQVHKMFPSVDSVEECKFFSLDNNKLAYQGSFITKIKMKEDERKYIFINRG